MSKKVKFKIFKRLIAYTLTFIFFLLSLPEGMITVTADNEASGYGGTGSVINKGNGQAYPINEGVKLTFRIQKTESGQVAGTVIGKSFNVFLKELWDGPESHKASNTAYYNAPRRPMSPNGIYGETYGYAPGDQLYPDAIIVPKYDGGTQWLLAYIEEAQMRGGRLTTEYFKNEYTSLAFIEYIGKITGFGDGLQETLRIAYGSNWVLEIEPIQVYFHVGKGFIAGTWDQISKTWAANEYNVYTARDTHKKSIKPRWPSVGDLTYRVYNAPNLAGRTQGEFGIGLVKPPDDIEEIFPVNFICTDLEAEYVSSKNEVRVKASFAVDAYEPYQHNGFATKNLNAPGKLYGLMSEQQVVDPKKNELPNYLPGITNVTVNLYWWVPGTNPSTSIKSKTANTALYVENAVQFQNPSAKLSGDSPQFIANAEKQPHYPGQAGPKHEISVSASIPLGPAPNNGDIYEEDGWIYFKLPDNIPSTAKGVTVWARVNDFDYYNSSNMTGNNKASRPTPGSPSLMINSEGKYIVQSGVETDMLDNKKYIELEIPKFNLKVGFPPVGEQPSDPVYLKATYDVKSEKLSITAPSIFDSWGDFTTLDDEGNSYNKDTINTVHTLSITYKSGGKTEYTTEEIVSHRSGEVVKLTQGGVGSGFHPDDTLEKSWKRYIGDWKYDEASKWSSNVKYFGQSDSKDGSLSTGTESNIKKQKQYYEVSGSSGGGNQQWVTDFPMPLQQTTYVICLEVNPSIDESAPKSTTARVPDGESTYSDNKVCIEITLGPEVNLTAQYVDGKPQPTAYTPRGNPDYTKPYSVTVQGCGTMSKFFVPDGTEGLPTNIETRARLYIAPELPGGGNPFSIIAQTEWARYEIPVNSNKQFIVEDNKIIVAENRIDVLASGANNSKSSPYTNGTLSKVGDQLCYSYTFSNLSGDFLMVEGQRAKKIYVAYYINPTNLEPGTRPDELEETTYLDNFVTQEIYLESEDTCPAPAGEYDPRCPCDDNNPADPRRPCSYKEDPELDCTIYVIRAGGSSTPKNRYYPVNVTSKNHDTTMARLLKQSDVSALVNNAGTELGTTLKNEPYGGIFQQSQPLYPNNPRPWGYRELVRSYHDKQYDVGYLNPDLGQPGLCQDLYKVEENDYPQDYWQKFIKYLSGGTHQGVRNEYTIKWMDVVDNKAYVRVNSEAVWELRMVTEAHCICDGDGGDGWCTHEHKIKWTFPPGQCGGCDYSWSSPPFTCDEDCAIMNWGTHTHTNPDGTTSTYSVLLSWSDGCYPVRPVGGNKGNLCVNPNCNKVYWEFYRLPNSVAVTYALLFDNVYTSNSTKSRVFSTQGRGTEYDYLLAAGYGIGAIIRTRFLTDYLPGYGADFEMEGWSKFSMSSSTHNARGLTNGGYPLEQTGKTTQQILQGSGPAQEKVEGIDIKHMYPTSIASDERRMGYGVYNKGPYSSQKATSWGQSLAQTTNGQYEEAEIWMPNQTDEKKYPSGEKVQKGSVFKNETKYGAKENGYPTLWYYKLEPKVQPDSQGHYVRQMYTNKNYPDAIKIDSASGQPKGSGQGTVTGKLNGYTASPIEKATGYVGLKVWTFAYITNRTPVVSYENSNSNRIGNYQYQAMFGICHLANLAIVGTYENDTWVRPSDWK